MAHYYEVTTTFKKFINEKAPLWLHQQEKKRQIITMATTFKVNSRLPAAIFATAGSDTTIEKKNTYRTETCNNHYGTGAQYI